MADQVKIYEKILNEIHQTPPSRSPLFQEIEEQLDGRAVIAFYTSSAFPAMILDEDALMIQEALQHSNLSRGLALVVNSQGGSGIAAERIINICRTFSKGDFEVIVPFQAKSAATMICMGAKKIYMSPSSELGPIDPQTEIKVEDKNQLISIGWVLKSYDELFEKAVVSKGHIEPYLQQLLKYDPRQIEQFRSAARLAEDIAISSLKSGMMSAYSKTQIKTRIKSFCAPELSLAHARPIFACQAKQCGLEIELLDTESTLWGKIWELHLRLHHATSHRYLKIIESKGESYQAGNPFIQQGRQP